MSDYRAALEDAYREGYEQRSVDDVYANFGPNADAAWNMSDAKRFAALPDPDDLWTVLHAASLATDLDGWSPDEAIARVRATLEETE